MKAQKSISKTKTGYVPQFVPKPFLYQIKTCETMVKVTLCDNSQAVVNYCHKDLHPRGLKCPGSPTEH